MYKWWKEEAADMLLLFVGLMILLFYPFFVWGEKTISAAGGDFPIQSIIFLHKAPMDYKMIWTTINLYRSLILARSHNDLIYSRFVSLLYKSSKLVTLASAMPWKIVQNTKVQSKSGVLCKSKRRILRFWFFIRRNAST